VWTDRAHIARRAQLFSSDYVRCFRRIRFACAIYLSSGIGAIDTPYTELEKRIAKSIIPGVDVDAVDGMSALNETASSAGLGPALPRKPILKNSTVPDPYPTGTKVQVFWAGDKQWFNGTILSSTQ